jgi:hypothetical protein
MSSRGSLKRRPTPPLSLRSRPLGFLAPILLFVLSHLGQLPCRRTTGTQQCETPISTGDSPSPSSPTDRIPGQPCHGLHGERTLGHVDSTYLVVGLHRDAPSGQASFSVVHTYIHTYIHTYLHPRELPCRHRVYAGAHLLGSQGSSRPRFALCSSITTRIWRNGSCMRIHIHVYAHTQN